MLIAIATGDGLREKIRSKVSGFKGHIQITKYDANNSDISVMPIDKNQNFYPKFSTIKGIKNIQIYANQVGLIRTKTDFEGVVFKGVSTDYDWTFFNEYLIAGKTPNFNQERTRDILLSKTIVDRLKLKLNDTINVTFFKSKVSKLPSNRKLVITGIYNTGFLEFDKNMMIGDIRQIQRLNRWDSQEIGRLEVLAHDHADIDALTRELYDLAPVTVDAMSMYASFYNIFEWLSLFDFNIYLIIFIMILVATINMVTALIVLILERTRMIGIFQVMGAGNWRLQKIFLLQAAYIVLWGLFWGNLLGLGCVWIQDAWQLIELDPKTYYVHSAPVSLPIEAWGLLNLSTFVLCLLFLLIPSYLVAQISPVRALRFDG